MQQRTTRVPAVASELSALRQFMGAFWSEQGLSEPALFPFDLALEEVFTNIVMHGLPPAGDLVEVSLALEEGRVTLCIADGGPAFDPLQEAPAPDLDADLDARSIGGLGVFLVKELMDTVTYQYRDRKNVLTMSKRVDA
jgi:anti-sigma regulatory factor (Ser/Thr protein kinase)